MTLLVSLAHVKWSHKWIFIVPLYIFVLIMSSEMVLSLCFISAVIDDACKYVVIAQKCFTQQFMFQIAQLLQALTSVFLFLSPSSFSIFLSFPFSLSYYIWSFSFHYFISISNTHTLTHRGQVAGEHEWGVAGGGGEILAREGAKHCPRRLLEAPRLFTTLEGKLENWLQSLSAGCPSHMHNTGGDALTIATSPPHDADRGRKWYIRSAALVTWFHTDTVISSYYHKL